MKNLKSNKKGFTLVELLVVMAVIAVLSLLAVPKFLSLTRRANEATFAANHRMLKSAIAMYIAVSGGEMPPDMTALSTYVDGGDAGNLNGSPTGATYTWDGKDLYSVLESEYTVDRSGKMELTYTPD